MQFFGRRYKKRGLSVKKERNTWFEVKVKELETALQQWERRNDI